eukprot:TRINITY_DN1705_c0_g1_i1.p1 TRINITY_DN1705_c0_g1~~TRINITY_DN1705_c0_g1_i1.p1  ORF type:complete len:329 (+),score=59.94 TRINITY_DN1705_c0_g1_i1:106-987(+)
MERFIRESLLRHIAPYLTQHDLGLTALVCSSWKDISYLPHLYLHVSFPLLSKSDLVDQEDFRGKKSFAECIQMKLYSPLPPPPYIDQNGKKPFEDILQIMLNTKQRFSLTQTVDFKNFMFSDEALDMAVKIFPRLEKIFIDGDRVTQSGLKLLQNFTRLRFLYLNIRKDSDIKTRLKLPASCEIVWGFLHLEENFQYCNKCGACFNINKNGPKSCLHHTQEYSGWGHSGSAFQCCGSNTPCYPGTPGCTYGYHSSTEKIIYYGIGYESWLPELLETPYTYEGVPNHPFISRRE